MVRPSTRRVRHGAMGVLGVASLAAVAAPARGDLTIDNFESYTANQAIATSSTSNPWLRFGEVNDNLYAKATNVLDGSLSAALPVGITGTGSASTAYNYTAAAPVDFSAYA